MTTGSSIHNSDSNATLTADLDVYVESLGRNLLDIAEWRTHRIRKAAYFKAKRRHFKQGHELDYWLETEREVEQAWD